MFVRLFMFGRKRDKTNTVVVPSWEETVKIMHGKDMNFADEVVDVIYCADGSVRCVLLKSDLGSYKYLFERLFAFDEDEFVIFGRDIDPGYWQPIYDFKSFFDSEETARREMKADPLYKTYFNQVEDDIL